MQCENDAPICLTAKDCKGGSFSMSQSQRATGVLWFEAGEQASGTISE